MFRVFFPESDKKREPVDDGRPIYKETGVVAVLFSEPLLLAGVLKREPRQTNLKQLLLLLLLHSLSEQQTAAKKAKKRLDF